VDNVAASVSKVSLDVGPRIKAICLIEKLIAFLFKNQYNSCEGVRQIMISSKRKEKRKKDYRL
jgi:hypothetical protein